MATEDAQNILVAGAGTMGTDAFANVGDFLGITDEQDLSQFPPLRDDVGNKEDV